MRIRRTPLAGETRQFEVVGLRVLLIGLYSERYPALSETHGVSVIAGAIAEEFADAIEALRVLDLVITGCEDVAAVVAAIDEMSPNVVGISVPYGTYDVLLDLRGQLTRLLDQGHCVLIGGALPTYIGERLLAEVDNRLVIVVGEGEMAAVGAIRAWLGERSLLTVPNVQFCSDGEVTTTARELAAPDSLATPYRSHVPDIIAAGAQIFAEASRACSWAACSFCLRGLTDIEGRPREFRRLPAARLVADLRRLMELGVPAVSFADEDFLGGTTADVAELVRVLHEAVTTTDLEIPPFDVSATIRSIFCERDDPRTAAGRKRHLGALARLGLRKVFLGVESGSAKQLRRYCKGHTAAECVGAARAVLAAGCRLEIGFVMFDPLCSLAEVGENARFLLDHDLARHASGPTSELRLQVGSRYLSLLERAERESGRRLYERELDPNTLSFRYEYYDPAVAGLAEVVRQENERSHPLIYRLKGLSRFGDGAIMEEATYDVRRALGDYRTATVAALASSVQRGADAYTSMAQEALAQLASDFVRILARHPDDRPLVAQAVQIAEVELSAVP